MKTALVIVMIRYEPLIVKEPLTMKKPNEVSCTNRVCHILLISKFTVNPFFSDEYNHITEN